MAVAALCLGSNLGDRADFMRRGLQAIAALRGVAVRVVSSIHETEPWGDMAQQRFLNQAVLLDTQLSAHELLAALLDIERQLGRLRDPGRRNGPRTFDADILFYDDMVLCEQGLTLPHPRMAEREFVLVALVEVASEWVHPVERRTVRQMLGALRGRAMAETE